MSCAVSGNLVICRPTPKYWTGLGEARDAFCFNCRKRLQHWLWMHDEPMSYYEPIFSWRCTGCWGDHTEFPS